MPISEFTGEPVEDTNSEAWRYECEIRYLLDNYPRRVDKHLFLYGVEDREDLFRIDNQTGQKEIKEQYDRSKSGTLRNMPASVFKFRGLEEADKILADAKRLYELRQKRAAAQPAAA